MLGERSLAWTTADAFADLSARLEVTDYERLLVVDVREQVTQALRAAGDRLRVRRVAVIGACDRNTAIPPVRDVDILVVLESAARRRFGGDPYELLRALRAALAMGGQTGSYGRVVRIPAYDGPAVDVAPVFERMGGGYLMPHAAGGWIATDPDEHRRWLAHRDRLLDGQLRPLVRLLKRWDRAHGDRLPTFHLEAMAADAFRLGIGTDHRRALHRFFLTARLDVEDPAGHAGDLSRYLPPSVRARVQASLEASAERALRALAAEARCEHPEAIRLWRILLGEGLRGGQADGRWH